MLSLLPLQSKLVYKIIFIKYFLHSRIPFIRHISLIANEDNNNILSAFSADIIYPSIDAFKREPV